MIEVRALTKTCGDQLAVDGSSFTAPAGKVTGFLGPNDAGKTTTFRCLLGLADPTSGTALIGGKTYRELASPRRRVGAVLESTGFHPTRTGRNHLRVVARSAGIDAAKIDPLLELVGLRAAADRRVGGYSLGMRQRLGLATAMLGALRAAGADHEELADGAIAGRDTAEVGGISAQAGVTVTELSRVSAGAKLAIGAAVGVAVGAITSIACLGIAGLVYDLEGATFPFDDTEVWLTLAGSLVYTSLFAVIGVALGALVGNPVLVVAVSLAWFAVVEHTLVNLAPDIGRWLPAAAGQAIVRTPLDNLLSPLAGAVLLAVYGTAIAVAGIRVTATRDT